MIHINNKENCTGCGACIAVCPVGAISFILDDEGNRYPKIDGEKCVKCDLCSRTCPVTNLKESIPVRNTVYQQLFYATQLVKKEDLDAVSSGGAFLALAEAVLLAGGVVYGAAQVDVESVFHIRIDNVQAVKQICRSKYVQSDVRDSFMSARKDLDDGKIVLFSGTGCQIAGLNMFLGKEYRNLYTCDVVCHGVPCGLAWEKYLEETQERQKSRITEIVFRCKKYGWKDNHYLIAFDNGDKQYEKSVLHLYHKGYLMGLFYRPSCGNCKFAKLPRVSDISLADYWGYEGELLSHGDLGISLVVINNEKGKRLFERAKSLLECDVSTKNAAIRSCTHLVTSPSNSKNRSIFINVLKNKGYYKAASVFVDEYKFKRIVTMLYRVVLNRGD